MAAEKAGLTYICAMCKGTYVSYRTEEEAFREQVETFGEAHQAGDPVVCDDCYQMMIELCPPSVYIEEETKGRIGP